MTTPRYITLETSKLDEILEDKCFLRGFDAKEMVDEIKEALIENSLSIENLITQSVKKNLLYEQMMDWVHGKGEFNTKKKSIEFANYMAKYKMYEGQRMRIAYGDNMPTWVGTSDENIYQEFLEGKELISPFIEQHLNEQKNKENNDTK